MPLTTDPRTACGVLLAGRVAEAFSDDELRDMLARGVWMDGEALAVLWARGLGELAGVRPGEHLPGGMAERLTMHPLNGAGAGDVREALVGPGDFTCNLIAVAEGVGDLAHLDYCNGIDGGSCLSTYTNALGGRVVVSSYAPWQRLGRAAKRRQLLALADWLSGGRLPVLIEADGSRGPPGAHQRGWAARGRPALEYELRSHRTTHVAPACPTGGGIRERQGLSRTPLCRAQGRRDRGDGPLDPGVADGADYGAVSHESMKQMDRVDGHAVTCYSINSSV